MEGVSSPDFSGKGRREEILKVEYMNITTVNEEQKRREITDTWKKSNGYSGRQ